MYLGNSTKFHQRYIFLLRFSVPHFGLVVNATRSDYRLQTTDYSLQTEAVVHSLACLLLLSTARSTLSVDRNSFKVTL